MLGTKAIERLRPLLEGDAPSDNGEWSMHCPYHGDRKRSASVNITTEMWYCHGCGEGGEARDLIRDVDNWELPEDVVKSGKSSGKPKIEITESRIEGWAESLLANKEALKALCDKRGLTVATLKQYQIGYDGRAYTIPIRDYTGDFVNVRFYDINVDSNSDRRKIWSVEGTGTPSLFPIDQLDRNTILICEGEWDALVAIQNDIPAITRTGTADHWNPEWSQLFRGKKVYVCHDMDEKGQHANERIVASLRGKTLSTTVIKLPYPVKKKDGEDISDFFVRDGHTRADFIQLTREGLVYESLEETSRPTSNLLVPVTVMDSFNGDLVEQPLAMQVTVTGKRIPSYLVPKKVEIACDLGAGAKCKRCSMESASGHMIHEIGPESEMVLGMIMTSDERLRKYLFNNFSVVDCGRNDVNIVEHRTVEEIYVRPSIDTQAGGAHQDFTHRRVISAASHDLSSNQTVEIFGTIRPDPRNRTNEFQAWRVEKPKNTLETFKLTDEIREQLEVLRDDDDPLAMIGAVADDLSNHVTRIYHRRDLHMFVDLVFHSGLEIKLGEEQPVKGWLDAIVIGDTRTGKSEVTAQMIREYGMGEMISCESATYAGVVGGLDRMGDQQWIIKWGAIPVNDSRLVALDEVSGLTTEQIAQMSSIRSTGVAEMTKIQNERAMARTRLLWLANPRESRMDDFTFGVQALQPLIGNNEDVARFDMAMAVMSSEVSSELINTPTHRSPSRVFDQETLRNCLRWAWTRSLKEIQFTKPAVKRCMELANKLGQDFIETPPLVQAANVRVKLARIAVAIAMRTFSCDDKGRCQVTPVHMEAADYFLRELYGNRNFGYSIISSQRLEDQAETEQNMEEILEFIISRPGLIRFLKHTPVFDQKAIETVMNVGKEMSGGMVNQLWGLKAVKYEEGKLKLESSVLRKIREMQQ